MYVSGKPNAINIENPQLLQDDISQKRLNFGEY